MVDNVLDAIEVRLGTTLEARHDIVDKFSMISLSNTPVNDEEEESGDGADNILVNLNLEHWLANVTAVVHREQAND